MNGLGIANLPEFLQSQCTDVTPLVSGDAVKAFPNLANLPPYAWRNAVFNNRIYAVPSVRHSISSAILFGKGKLLDTMGGISFKNTDDFRRAMKQLTGGGSQWGLGATSGAATNGTPGIATYFLESYAAPNIWRESNGKLTKDWETDEFKAAIAYVRQLWELATCSWTWSARGCSSTPWTIGCGCIPPPDSPMCTSRLDLST